LRGDRAQQVPVLLAPVALLGELQSDRAEQALADLDRDGREGAPVPEPLHRLLEDRIPSGLHVAHGGDPHGMSLAGGLRHDALADDREARPALHDLGRVATARRALELTAAVHRPDDDRRDRAEGCQALIHEHVQDARRCVGLREGGGDGLQSLGPLACALGVPAGQPLQLEQIGPLERLTGMAADGGQELPVLIADVATVRERERDHADRVIAEHDRDGDGRSRLVWLDRASDAGEALAHVVGGGNDHELSRAHGLAGGR
jgi:hypothetical protein